MSKSIVRLAHNSHGPLVFDIWNETSKQTSIAINSNIFLRLVVVETFKKENYTHFELNFK